jgi:acyl-CoA synthetase (AMP-forming)/AMP-acid ligase II
MFASPGLLEPLSEHCRDSEAWFPLMRRVISAGAPVDAQVLSRMAEALPENALLHSAYGATETLPVASIDDRAILGETRVKTAGGAGVCVGRPVAGAEVRCIRVEDGPIPAWTADLEVPCGMPGEICVRGPQVTRGYLARPEADALAKIADPSAGLWHRMGDVGYFDDRGRIWFCGRKSQRVRTAEGDLYPDQCEAMFNIHPEIRRSALVGVGEPGRQIAFLCVELGSGADLGRWTSPAPAILADLWNASEPSVPATPMGAAVRDRVRRQVEANARFFLLLRGRPLPVDTRHNAKIQREVLAKWAAEKLGR